MPLLTDGEQLAQEQAKKDTERADRCATIRNEVATELGLRYSPALASFESFKCDRQDQSRVLNRLKSYAATINNNISAGRNMILYGPVGTGKDHLLAALLYAAADACIASKWVNGLDLYGSWRDQIDAGTSESEMVKRFAEYPVLAISDPIPPAGTPSAWNVGQLYRIVDARYRAMRPMWLTLNSAGDSDSESALSAPVFDRLKHNAEIIECRWPSYRERKN